MNVHIERANFKTILTLRHFYCRALFAQSVKSSQPSFLFCLVTPAAGFSIARSCFKMLHYLAKHKIKIPSVLQLTKKVYNIIGYLCLNLFKTQILAMTF